MGAFMSKRLKWHDDVLEICSENEDILTSLLKITTEFPTTNPTEALLPFSSPLQFSSSLRPLNFTAVEKFTTTDKKVSFCLYSEFWLPPRSLQKRQPRTVHQCMFSSRSAMTFGQQQLLTSVCSGIWLRNGKNDSNCSPRMYTERERHCPWRHSWHLNVLTPSFHL